MEYLILSLAILASIISPIIVHKLISIALRKTNKNSSFIHKIIIPSIDGPMLMFVSSIIFSKSFEFMSSSYIDINLNYINKIIDILSNILITSSVSWLIHKIIIQLKYRIKDFNISLDLNFIFIILHVLTLLATLVIIGDIAGFNMNSILAFGGIGGLAASLAAKDTLANFFNTITIMIDKPFKEGDEIYIKEQDIQGIVTKIGWRVTYIRTLDRCPVYFPNTLFGSYPIYNKSRMIHRRIDTVIRVKSKEAQELIMLANEIEKGIKSFNKYIDKSQDIFAALSNVSDNVCDINVRMFLFFIPWKEFCIAKQDILLHLHQIIEKNNFTVIHNSSSIQINVNLKKNLETSENKDELKNVNS